MPSSGIVSTNRLKVQVKGWSNARSPEEAWMAPEQLSASIFREYGQDVNCWPLIVTDGLAGGGLQYVPVVQSPSSKLSEKTMDGADASGGQC